MRVLYVTPECAPLAKAGGLGDVSAALPAALRALGHEVDVLLPAYAGVLAKSRDAVEHDRVHELGFECRLLRHERFLLAECAALYERAGTPYQDAAGEDWPDNALRFGVFSKVASRLAAGYDVVHCNDWPTALAPVFARGEKTLVTIHNLAFQGNFERAWLARLELPEELFSMRELEFHGRISFLKGGLVHAGAINTVSTTYAREIQTEEFGCGLDGLLRSRRGALTGILNGIDTAVWDPATDPHLAARYDATSLDRKSANKRELQKRLDLQPGDDPLIGFVGRLTHQKGADLLAAAASEIAALPAQIALLGRGERSIEAALAAAAARHPGRIAVAIRFDEALAHLIEAGADLFVMPSRFEPCGLNQMYSQRYGTPPVVRATGGLADTVQEGETGFLFESAEASALAAAVRRALAARRDPDRWREIQRAGMQRDFSWSAAARRYAALYSGLSMARRT
ncbi:MAG TPA: glycogen synthase GlgA [Burkholderiales bacterium]|nr:glycogen synthase GlgA [Burkholderiales bacterium]